ncbi:hypothetical protein ACA081_00610 [Candidatus Hodgkinia cicadicola]
MHCILYVNIVPNILFCTDYNGNTIVWVYSGEIERDLSANHHHLSPFSTKQPLNLFEIRSKHWI